MIVFSWCTRFGESLKLIKFKFVFFWQSVRAISEEFSALGLPNYPTGIPFIFWEQYIWLGEHLLTAVAIVLAASFLVMAVILCNFWAAMFIVSLCTCCYTFTSHEATFQKQLFYPNTCRPREVCMQIHLKFSSECKTTPIHLGCCNTW